MEEKRLECYKATDLSPLALMQLLTDLPPLQHGYLGVTFIAHSLQSSIFDHRQFLLVATPTLCPV